MSMPKKRSEDMLLQTIQLHPHPTEQQMDRARLVICGQAGSASEAAEILAMMGLLGGQ